MSYTLRFAPSAGKRVFEAAKFRDRVPALEARSSSVRVERQLGGRPSEQRFVLDAGSKRYEGTREAVGTSAQTASCYMVVHVKDGAMEMMPLADWYAFRPAVTHATLGSEDAEDAMKRREKRSVMAEQKIEEKIAKQLGEDAAEGGASAAARKKRAKAEDDEFDDGAGPEWAASEMRDEDGNEGLDMEDEAQEFEDNDEDAFLDDDAIAFNERVQAKQSASLRAQKVRRSADDDDDDDELAEEEEEEEEGVVGGGLGGDAASSEWSRRAKEDLRAERKQLREEAGGEEEEEEDDDEWDDGLQTLKQILRSEPEPASEASAAPAAGAAAGGGTGKRSLTQSDGASSEAKRAKMDPTAVASAVLASQAVAKVRERDIVLLLHQKGAMSLKELLQAFKAFTTTPESKKAFIQMVSRVAYLLAEEGSGGKKAKLKEETLAEYQLE